MWTGGSIIAVITALAAAITAYVLNRYAFRKVGSSAVTLEGPALEEISKTLLAITMRSSILATHLAFGIMEAAYDLVVEARAGHSGSRGLVAGALSVLGHTLFGAVTLAGARSLGSWQAGVLLAVLAHAAWNRVLVAG